MKLFRHLVKNDKTDEIEKNRLIKIKEIIKV